MINLNRAFIRAYDRAQAVQPMHSRAVERFHLPATSERLATSSGELLADSVRTLLDSSSNPRGVIFVRGTRRAIGRTTVAICLAQTLATTTRSVALVDADWENPSLGQLLLSEPYETDWLADADQPISELAIESRQHAFTLFPLRSSPPPMSDFRMNESNAAAAAAPSAASRQQLVHRAQRRLCTLTEQFAIVIVDTNCWNNAQPATPLLSGDGASLIVTDARSSATEDWMPLVGRLRDRGERRIGRIENFSPTSRYSPSPDTALPPVQD